MKKELVTLIYGTGNQGKIINMKKMLEPLFLTIEGIGEYLNPLPTVEEVGKDPLENAIKKAITYYKYLNRPVFSCDSGLYIQGLTEKQQPGVHVRRVEEKNLTDEEMIAYYANIASSLGGKCVARYRNAISLVMDEDHIYSSMADDLSGDAFIISDSPHKKRLEGYPLDSLSVEIESGRYYFDKPSSFSYSHDKGHQSFFIKAFHEQGYIIAK